MTSPLLAPCRTQSKRPLASPRKEGFSETPGRPRLDPHVEISDFRMSDVGCRMSDVGCRLSDFEISIPHGLHRSRHACHFLPHDRALRPPQPSVHAARRGKRGVRPWDSVPRPRDARLRARRCAQPLLPQAPRAAGEPGTSGPPRGRPAAHAPAPPTPAGERARSLASPPLTGVLDPIRRLHRCALTARRGTPRGRRPPLASSSAWTAPGSTAGSART